ncbi:hypothetical protein CHARACLAT_010163 [Characodon lateralis]|uniref:Uncharacterized protein n=1 Tax=Characodon lateralis TaxID=208331 RepID=A0ABU7DPX5_9TELE|nr:hypothetical protein [Characodon lateralis]
MQNLVGILSNSQSDIKSRTATTSVIAPAFQQTPRVSTQTEMQRLGLGLLPLLDQFRSPIKCGAYFLLPHYLPVVGVSARWCTCGSRCPGLSAYVCAGSLPVAVCRGLDAWALPALCLGSDMSRGLGSLGPWLALLWRRQLWVCGLVAALPWGFCTVAGGWFL